MVEEESSECGDVAPALAQGRQVYVQGVYEIVPTLNLVARYEHIDPSGREEDAHIGDVGVAWIPKPYLHVKASYRFTDKQTEEVRRGLSMSFSFIF